MVAAGDLNLIPNAKNLYSIINNNGKIKERGENLDTTYRKGEFVNSNEYIYANNSHIARKSIGSSHNNTKWSFSVSLGEYMEYKTNITVRDELINVSYDIKRKDGTEDNKTYILFSENGKPYKPISSITLNQEKVFAIIGDEVKLSASIYPTDADETQIIWESSDDKVANVKDGVVLAISNGECEITASNSDKTVSAKCKVSVVDQYISIAKSYIEIIEDESYRIDYTKYPGDLDIIWESSNNSVAKVNNGVVMGIAIGNATITARSVDGKSIASCNIRVNSILKYISLSFSSTAIITGGYVVGNVSCSINNDSNFDIIITKFEIIDTRTNSPITTVESPDFPLTLSGKMSKDLSYRLYQVYLPRFVWHYKYNNKDYKIQYDYPVK